MLEATPLRSSLPGMSALRLGLICCAFTAACNKVPADYAQLKADNERLRAELEKLNQSFSTQDASTGASVAFQISINELWAQRYDDNKFRAKQRLDQKTMRVTGLVEEVTPRTVSLYGKTTRFGNVSMVVQLEEGYAKRVQQGLGALDKGVSLTAQGKFVFDKMWLDQATFVDESGKPLLSADLMKAAESSPAPPL